MPTNWTLLPWKPTKHPGISLLWLHSQRPCGDTVVLIRMEPGASYPAHRHVGVERLFVLQGAYRDRAGVYHAGEEVVHPPGSSHHPIAEPGEDCILLATAEQGIEPLGEEGAGVHGPPSDREQ